jgi:hypothetical protein
LNRFDDWPAKLEAVVARARKLTFRWGRHDCCQFVARAVAAMTGVDLLADYRPYATRRQAAAELKRVAGSPAVSVAATRALGRPLPSKLYAGRGDVVLVETETGAGRVEETLGVCLGPVVAVVARAGGFAEFPLTDARVRAAWRV